MSHHLDSPIARQDIRLDLTDLYVFRGETGTVFVTNLCHSIFGPIPAPGYHPEGMYEFKIDLNDDATEDLTYPFTFTERDKDGQQSYGMQVAQRTCLPATRCTPSCWKFLMRSCLRMGETNVASEYGRCQR